MASSKASVMRRESTLTEEAQQETGEPQQQKQIQVTKQEIPDWGEVSQGGETTEQD